MRKQSALRPGAFTRLWWARRRLALTGVAGCLIGASLTAPVQAQALDRMIFASTYPNGAQGYISSMRVNTDGSLALIDTIATSDTGCSAVSLSMDGAYLAVSHATAKSTENVDVYAVNPDGTLSFILTQGVPDSPLDLMWMTDRELAVTQASFGGSNSVGVYHFDPDAGSLTEIDREYAGLFHTDLAVDPLGRALFANDSNGYLIRVLAIEDDGELTPDESVSTSSVYPLGMDVSRYGDFLYAGGGISSNGDKVLGYGFAGLGEGLSTLQGAPYISPGSSPKQALPTLGDRVCMVAHGTDATVRSFLMDSHGVLTSTGHSFDVGLQGSLGKLTTMGDLLFVPDNTTAIDGKSGIYVFRINADGSFSMIGNDLYDTGLSTPNSVATWDPKRGIYLRTRNVAGGESANFYVSNATPNQQTAVLYSLRGTGLTFVKPAQVTVDLRSPQLLGKSKRADADGHVQWLVTIPKSATGRSVWFQPVQYGRVGNVVGRVIR